MKEAILILGMHRSGTSALSGVINILGAYLGEDLMKATPDNPKGYFENEKISYTNERILQEYLNSSWHDLTDMDLLLRNRKSGIDELIKNTINDTLTSSQQPILIKDPRLCLLLPFYINVLTEMGYKIHYVYAFREENEIIKSLISRDGFTEDKCRKLITKYFYCLRSVLFHEPHLTIRYAELLEYPNATLSAIEKHLPFLNYSDENKQKAKEILDINLKHH